MKGKGLRKNLHLPNLKVMRLIENLGVFCNIVDNIDINVVMS